VCRLDVCEIVRLFLGRCVWGVGDEEGGVWGCGVGWGSVWGCWRVG